MLDSNSFINNINENYSEEILKSRLDEINNNINKLNSEIDEWQDIKKINKADKIMIIILSIVTLINPSVGIIPIIWIIIYRKIIASLIIVPHIINNIKKELKCEKKKREKEIQQYEKFKEKRKEILKDDKDYKKIRKNLLEKIDNLDKDELLAIRTIITEYTTNRDIPSQVGNIAQFLTETQVGDIAIKETSLYNKQVDKSASDKGRTKNYSIKLQQTKLD